MLLVMSFGPRPFRWESGELSLKLEPVLPAWLFTEEQQTDTVTRLDGSADSYVFPDCSYSALLLGRTMVSYVNPSLKDTFGPDAVSAQRYRLIYDDGRELDVEGPALAGEHARDVRDRKVRRILVDLA